MKVEVLAVGTELLMGQIANTNAQYISNRLPEIGMGVYYHSVVGDNPERLKGSLEIALKRCDVVIMTGGLGPTQDDLTKETVAQAFGRKLVLDEESLDKIKSYFKKINREMADNNVKQAYLPEKSIIIKNNNGTAPGCIIEAEEKVVVMLPGPPSEMKPMFEETVMPYFREKSEMRLVSKHLRIFGIGESLLEKSIIDLIEGQSNPTIAPYAKEGEVTLRVTASGKSCEEAEKLIEPIINEIEKRVGDCLYSKENKELEEVTGELLIRKGITISIAESCTGGMISGRLTNIPGISEVFNRSAVTYSNIAKMEELGVKEETLAEFGAVSRETAIEMAEGIRKKSKSDIGVSVTGIAGPGGGSDEKPVGLVFIALSDKKGVECKQLNLMGNRGRIRNLACLNVFDMIRRRIL